MNSLELADLLSKLVAAADPVTEIWAYLVELWSREEDRERYFREGERYTMYLEKVLDAAYPEFYTEILPQRCAEANFDATEANAPIVWLDGLSLREALLLCQDIDGRCDLSFAYSALPSDTVHYKAAIWEQLKGKRAEIKDVNRIRLDGDEAGVWCPLPDVELEAIRGRVKVRTLIEIYDKTREVLLNILKGLRGKRFIITSDHGYINTETFFLEVGGRRERESLKSLFGSDRYLENPNRADELIERGYIVPYGDFYLVRNRYAWPARGKYRVMLHGGVSLLECLVPVLRVKL